MEKPHDKNTEPASRTTTLIRVVMFAIVIASTAAAVISLKQLTNDGPITPERLIERDSLQHIAHPDTTESTDEPGTRSNKTDRTTTPASEPASYYNADEEPADTLTSTDVRSPLDAGYEDGYTAGKLDGMMGDERASYDETSQFPKAEQRQAYTDAYRRGYNQGFADGQQGKEFSVMPDNEENNELPDEEPQPAEEPKQGE